MRTAPLFSLLLYAGLAPAGVHTFDYFGQEQGLSNSVIRAVAQDGEGALWIGSREGLFRYDGASFEKYGADHGLPFANVIDVHVDRHGDLYLVSTQGYASYRNGKFEFVKLPLPADSARRVVGSDRSGRVYWGTKEGLFEARDQQLPRSIEATQGMAVWSVFVDDDATVWFGCNQEICHWDGQMLRRQTPRGDAGSRYEAFVRDGKGVLWARSAHGSLSRLTGGQFEVYRPKRLLGSGPLVRGPDGLLVAPAEDGLWLQTASGWDLISEAQGLPAGRIRCALYDQEGSLWLGFADLGIVRWRGRNRWESWTRNEGLPSSEVTAVVRSEDGAVWAGSRVGLARKAPGTDKWSAVGPQDRVTSDVRSLAITGDYVWVASQVHGLSVVETGSLRYRPVAASSGLTTGKILQLYVDATGQLFVLTRDGVFALTGTGAAPRFERRFTDVLEQPEAVYAMRRAHDGRIWLAGDHGLLRIGPKGVKRIGTDEGLRSKSLVFVAEGPDGDIWVGYAGNIGLTRIRDRYGRFDLTHYTKGAPLASNDICSLARDRRGWMWVGTDNGVDVFNGERWKHFGSRDGLIWHDVVLNAFFEDRQGDIWIGANRGLSRYRPDPALFEETAPPPALSSVRVGEQPASRQPPDTIAAGQGFLAVRYTARTFARAHAARFRYRLLGLSDSWIETAERVATFPNLQPGDYRFEVQAGLDGLWNPATAAFDFRIPPPWYRSWWFTGAVLFVAGAAMATFSYRGAMAQRVRREELERAVRERTAELEEAKNRTECEKRAVEEHRQEIEKLLNQAREANRLKSEFLANVSHEIRTPMNGILGMASLALQTPLSDDQREYIETVKTSGESLLALLNDILDFSKIEADRMELEQTPFDLNECLNDALQTIKAQAKAKGLHLSMGRETGLPERVAGDSLRVRQVLLNLLSNAVKFTERGSIRLVAGPDDSGDPEMVRFSVKDTGIGIPAEKTAVIFEAFRQGDGSITRKHGGTGLGLAICARLVERMDGRIWVESRIGEGSAFYFTARLGERAGVTGSPAPRESFELRRLAQVVGNGGNRKLRVLVAEDNHVNQRVVVRILEKLGHESDVAVDGAEALAMTSERHYDLVLMDVQMPGMDGMETTRRIREREAGTTTHLPILMLTASVMAGDRERCLAAGADAYLPKPIDVRALLRAIEDLSVPSTQASC